MLTILTLVLSVVLLSTPASSQWSRQTGPAAPPASAFLEHEGLLFMGTDHMDLGDLFVSDDEGLTWRDVARPNGGVSDLFANEGRLFNAGYLSPLFYSDDAGLTWSMAHGDQVEQGTTVEVIRRMDDGRLVAGTDPFFAQPLIVSSDNGTTWSDFDGSPLTRCYDIVVVGDVILTAGEDAGVHRSADGGATWTNAVTGIPDTMDSYRFAVFGDDIYMVGAGGGFVLQVFRSSDQGASWTPVGPGFSAHIGGRATVFTVHENDLYLGIRTIIEDGGLYRSSDGGASWTALTEELPGTKGASSVAFTGDEILVGSFDGVHRTADDGVTWTATWSGSSGHMGVDAIHLSGDRVVVGMQSNSSLGFETMRSDDGGESWHTAGDLVSSASAVDFYEEEGMVYAVLYGQPRGLAVSVDQGESFTMTGFESTLGSVLKCVCALGDIVLAGANDGLHRSADGGVTWTTDPSLGWVFDLVELDSDFYAALYPGGVVRSTDGGLTWSLLENGLDPAFYVNDLTVFDGTVYAAVNNGPVLRLEGEAWVDTNHPEDGVVAMVAVDGYLITGGFADRILVTDATHEWTDFSEGTVEHLAVESMAVGDEYIYIGSRSRGFWARPRSDLPTTTSVDDEVVRAPASLAVSAAPNPFNPLTVVSFNLPVSGLVSVTVFDTAGRRVRTLVEAPREAGTHHVDWNGRDHAGRGVPTGVYFVRVSASGYEAVRKVTLVR